MSGFLTTSFHRKEIVARETNNTDELLSIQNEDAFNALRN